MRVVARLVVGDARDAGVHVGAAELLGAHLLAGRGLHQRRPAEEDRPLLLHDHRLVGHRRHVGAARGARAHDHGDLRDALRRHARLVVEDAPEVVAVGEHLVLQRQERAARVHQVDAGQAVLERDLLRAQVLLDRDRVVGAALDGGVVGDDDALAPGDAADAGDEPRRRHGLVVDPVRGELAQLEKRRADVEQRLDALARQHLAAFDVARARALVAAGRGRRDSAVQVVDQRPHRRRVFPEFLGARIDRRGENGHASRIHPGRWTPPRRRCGGPAVPRGRALPCPPAARGGKRNLAAPRRYAAV